MFRTKKLRLFIPVLVVVVAAPAAVSAAAATTDPDGAYADQVVAQVQASTPEDAPGATQTPVPIASGDTGYTGASSDILFTIPDNPGEALTLESPGEAPLTVTPPDVQTTDAVLNTDSDAVVFPDNGDDVAVAIQAGEEGAQMSTVINSSTAPEDYQYAVDVPTGGSLTLIEGGSVAILDAEGYPMGYMAEPWARDNAGTTVPTHFSISGNTVVQHVPHRGLGLQYPVVADPYLGISLIKSASWTWLPRSGSVGAGWTLQVTPTWWARSLAGAYLAGYYGWRELYAKYKDRGLCCNLDGMRDQYICHQQFVAVRYPRKSTWNLDEWRKNVSYWSTVYDYDCNPPRGGSYVY